MRVLVCGGRDYQEGVVNALFRLEEEHGTFTEVVHGGARGVDTEAGVFARLRLAKEIIYRANWKLHGKSAGPRRNQKMLEETKPKLVIAFPGGKGTAHMKKLAKAEGYTVIEAK